MSEDRHKGDLDQIVPLVPTAEVARNNGSIKSKDDSDHEVKKNFKERPFLAAIFCLISACFFVICFMNSKVILGLWPSLSPFSVLFIRAVFSSLVMIPQALYTNKKIEETRLLAG